jgi:hypothetical protein
MASPGESLAKKPIKAGIFYDGAYFIHFRRHLKEATHHWVKLQLFNECLKSTVVDYLGPDPVEFGYCGLIQGLKQGHAADSEGFAPDADVWDAANVAEFLNSDVDVVMGEFPEITDKGCDVLLACTMMEKVLLDRLDCVVLVSNDGDYAALLHKITSHGVKHRIAVAFEEKNGPRSAALDAALTRYSTHQRWIQWQEWFEHEPLKNTLVGWKDLLPAVKNGA